MATESAAPQPIIPTGQAVRRASIRAVAVVALTAAVLLGTVGCSGSNGKAATKNAPTSTTATATATTTKAERRAQSSESADTGSAQGDTQVTKRPTTTSRTTSTTTRPGTSAATTAPVGGSTTAPRIGAPGAGVPGTAAPQTAAPGPTPIAPPQQVAVKAQVVQPDLPAGWGSVPATGMYAALLPCLGGVGGAGQPTAQVDGDHYSIGAPDQQVQVLTTTAVFPSVDVAKRVLDASSTPQFGQCATGVLSSQAKVAGARGGPLARVGGLPARGDQSVWFRASLTAADPAGGDTPLPVDALISPIRTANTVSYLLLVSTGGRVDQWMITDLSQGLADRQH